VFTFTVLLGTLFPLIAEALDDRKVSVGEPYFDRWALPLGLALVFLMGVGPALPWGRLSPARAWQRLAPPVVAGGLTVAAFAAGGFTGPWVLVTLFLCGFAAWANLGELIAPVVARRASHHEGWATATRAVLRRTRRRYGGHLAHHGVVMAVASLALYKGYKEEVDVTLRPGEFASIAGYTATFDRARFVEEAHRKAVAAEFTLSADGVVVASLAPRLNYYPTQREPVFTPDVHSTPARDVYLSIVEIEPSGAYVVLRLITVPGIWWLWVAPVVIAAGTAVAAWPERRRAPERTPAVAGARGAVAR
jgi:cytochrome c-type biogenesis protein CcmF